MCYDHKLIVERFRLRALKQTGIIPRSIAFIHEDLTLLSADLDMPISAATIVGKHFVHVKAAVGTDISLIHRDHAFCSHTILQNDALVIEDTSRDPRFADNPYVVAGPQIRFYAGAPLRTGHGQRLGAVCVMDDKPRTLTLAERNRLLASAIHLSEKLSFNDADWNLGEMSALHLLQTLRLESAHGDGAKIIALIDALYERLDQEAERQRIATMEQDGDPPT